MANCSECPFDFEVSRTWKDFYCYDQCGIISSQRGQEPREDPRAEVHFVPISIPLAVFKAAIKPELAAAKKTASNKKWDL